MFDRKFWLSKEVFLTWAFVFLIAAPLAVFGSSKTIYVDEDASGTEDGSADHPYETVSEALEHADDGDIVRVKSGEYKENIVIPKGVKVVSHKNDRSKVVIKADKDSEPAIIMKHGAKLESVTVKGGRHGVRIDDDAKAHIYDVTIKDSLRDGIHIDSAKTDKKHRVIIDTVTVKDNARSGVYSEKRDLVIIDSDIVSNGSDGLDLAAGTEAWLERSRFSDNRGSGIKFVMDGSSVWAKNASIRRNGREGVEANAYGAAGDAGFKKTAFIGNGRYGVSKVARTAAAQQSFGSLSFGTDVNENRFEVNVSGSISPVIRGF